MKLLRIEIFLKRKLRDALKGYFQRKDKKKLRNKGFVLISRNCWGGQIYQWLGLPYNTPFVGLFLFGPCYMKLLRNFDRYMKMELDFSKVSKYPDANITYPIGILDDIEIHFQHYENEEEARNKWNKRKQRMLKSDRNDYFFSICDRRGIDVKDIKEFHGMNFKHKISFSFFKVNGLNNEQHIKFMQNPAKENKLPPNGKKRFKLTFLYFDIVNYLNTGEVIRTRFKE